MRFLRGFYFVVFLYCFTAFTVWAQSDGLRTHSGHKSMIGKAVRPKKGEHHHMARFLRRTPVSMESNATSTMLPGNTNYRQHHAVPHHRLLKSPRHYESVAAGTHATARAETADQNDKKHPRQLKHEHVHLTPKKQQHRQPQHHAPLRQLSLPSAHRIETVASKTTISTTMHDNRRLYENTKKRSFQHVPPRSDRQQRRQLFGNGENNGFLGGLGLISDGDKKTPFLPLFSRVFDNPQGKGPLFGGTSDAPLLPIGRGGEGLLDSVADTLSGLPGFFEQHQPLLKNSILGNTLATARETVSTLPILGGASSELGGREGIVSSNVDSTKTRNLIRDSVATTKGAVKELAGNLVSSAHTVASSATKATQAGESLIKSAAERVLHLPAVARDMIRGTNGY